MQIRVLLQDKTIPCGDKGQMLVQMGALGQECLGGRMPLDGGPSACYSAVQA